jgi:PAS domain S-box-containing protein
MKDQSKTKQTLIQKEASLDEASEYAESIINTVREPLIALDQNLRVVKVSNSFYEFFKVKPEETVGQLIYDLGNKQWDIPKLRELLETILPQKTAFDNYEVEHDFAIIGRRIMLLNARQIERVLGKEKIILLAIEDITERKKLEEVQNQLAAIVESADDAIISENFKGFIESWNSGAEALYGYNANEVIGKSIALIMPPGHPDEYKEVLAKIAHGETIKHYETQRRRKDGQTIDVALTISPIRDISGKIISASTIASDITVRKEIEAGLEKTRKELAVTKIAADEASEYAESIINTVREPLIVLDQDLRVVTASRSFYEFFKVKPEETEGQLIYNLGNDQWDIPKLRELLETILPQKTTFDNYEVEHDFVTIGKRIMLLNARQIKRALGKERIILLAIEDITERKQLESLLIDSEERYRHLFETASDGIVFLEQREGKITHANPASEKMLGYTKKELIGNKLPDIGVLLDMGDFQTTIQNLDKSGIIHYNDVSVRTKSGQQMDTDIYLVDRATLVQCSIRDVTDRKQAEDALRESENKYRLLADNIHDVVFVLDMNLNYTYVSPSTKILRGYEPEEVIKVSPADTLTPSSWDLVVKTLSDVMELEKTKQIELNESRTIPLEMNRKDGTTVWTEVKFSFIRDKDKQPVGILGVTRDITERRQAEEVLRESEEQYRLVVENAKEAIIVTQDIKVVFVNSAAIGMIGYSKEILTSKSFTDFIHPDDLNMVVDHHIKRIKGEEVPPVYSFRVTGRDGTVIWCELNAAVIQWKGKPATLVFLNNITERKLAEGELQQTLDSLKNAVGATIQVMVSAIEMRDPYTAGHQLRAADLACAIAKEMGLPQDKIEGLRMAGSIHDIGKLSIPAEILSKPTKLTNIEFSLIKEHSLIGYEMLKNVESPWPLAQIVYQHHERMDGSGYPRNLKGDEIIIEARIMAVSDVVEAMASHRPYRPGLGIDAAMAEIEKNKGTHYDKTVADACLRLFREKGYQLLA